MSLDLRNFVNVNINYNVLSISKIQSGIVTLITKNPNFTKVTEVEGQNVYSNIFEKSGPNKDGIFYSESDFNEAKTALEITDTSLDKYVKCFFRNKGRGLQIIGGYYVTSPVTPISTYIVNVLKTLDYRFVLITSDADENDLRIAANSIATTNVVSNVLTNQNTVPTFSGLNEKFFITSTSDRSGRVFDSLSLKSEAPEWDATKYYAFNNTTKQYDLVQTEPASWSENYINYFEVGSCSKDNYLIKVGDKGIEMTAAAYFSKVRRDVASTLDSYEFTIEDVTDFESSVINDNNTGVNLIKAHFNFDTNLVNGIRNYPGDSISGVAAMNYYIKILLTQDVTEAVMDLLVSKIKFNQSGINRLNNAISQEMNVYINNGYLNTEYIWTGDDIYYNFNGVQYLICSKNTPLVKGYKCSILPLNSLTPEQKEGHVLPPVYLLLADQTGIRSIVINGDIY